MLLALASEEQRERGLTVEVTKSVDYGNPSPAQKVRWLMDRAGLDIPAAARAFEVDEKTVRDWCAGAAAPPRMATLALERPAQHEVRDTGS